MVSSVSSSTVVAGTVSVLLVAVVIGSMAAAGVFGGDDAPPPPAVEGADLSNITAAPSGMPSLRPSVPPQWVVNYVKAGTEGLGGIAMEFDVGVNRDSAAYLGPGNCDDGDRDAEVEGVVLNQTIVRKWPGVYTDRVKVNYDVVEGNLRDSNLWDEERRELRFCHRMQLTLPLGGGDAWVMVEDVRAVTLTLGELTASFGDFGLTVELTGNETNATSADDGGEDGGRL